MQQLIAILDVPKDEYKACRLTHSNLFMYLRKSDWLPDTHRVSYFRQNYLGMGEDYLLTWVHGYPHGLKLCTFDI